MHKKLGHTNDLTNNNIQFESFQFFKQDFFFSFKCTIKKTNNRTEWLIIGECKGSESQRTTTSKWTFRFCANSTIQQFPVLSNFNKNIYKIAYEVSLISLKYCTQFNQVKYLLTCRLRPTRRVKLCLCNYAICTADNHI